MPRSYVDLFTSFSGRIGRQSWWIAFVSIMLAAIVGGYLIQPEAFTEEPAVPSSRATLFFQLALFIPASAITFTRCNDRNWPTWLPAIVCLASLPLYIGPFFGVLEMANPNAATWEWGYVGLIILIGVALIIDNGFLRGTVGPNQHGPDPVED